jgi:hypothetical protein
MTATIIKKLDFDYWRSERQGFPEIRARLVAQRERERAWMQTLRKLRATGMTTKQAAAKPRLLDRPDTTI